MITKLKKIWKNSFAYKIIKKIVDKHYRKRLTNTDFTILCPNCIGGVIYNRLGQRFNSPTIDLSINTSEFGYFLENLDYYISQDMIDGGLNSHNKPVGIIKGDGNGIPDIYINFIHYDSFEHGRDKWNERKKRIKKDNTYVIMYDINDLNEDDYNKAGYASEDDLKKFESFKCNNKVLLTRSESNNKPYAHYIKPKYNGPYPIVYLTRNIFGINVFETKFDYVSFLNKK